MEERLDCLVDLLKASEDNSAPLSGPSEAGTEGLGFQNRFPACSKSLDQHQSGGRDLVSIPPPVYNTSAPPTCICHVSINEEDFSPMDSDADLLSIYMNHLCSSFPFVVVPPSSTPASLQRTRPFLLKAIRLVASLRSLHSMRGQRHSFMRYISEAVLIKSERSLDLLQSILVLLGFYHYHCLLHTQFNSLTQLAISMIGDMGLNKNSIVHERTHSLGMKSEELQARKNDERRSIVGVWYMSSK